MSFLTNLFSNGLGPAVDSVGNALDNLITSNEEKLQIELEEKKAEQQFNIEMKRLGLDETKAFLQDTSDARNMNVKVQEAEKASWLSKNITPVLAFSTVFLGFMLFYIFAFKKVDVVSKDIVIYILGALSAILSQIFSFYFGSSQGSKDKAKVIDDLTNK